MSQLNYIIRMQKYKSFLGTIGAVAFFMLCFELFGAWRNDDFDWFYTVYPPWAVIAGVCFLLWFIIDHFISPLLISLADEKVTYAIVPPAQHRFIPKKAVPESDGQEVKKLSLKAQLLTLIVFGVPLLSLYGGIRHLFIPSPNWLITGFIASVTLSTYASLWVTLKGYLFNKRRFTLKNFIKGFCYFLAFQCVFFYLFWSALVPGCGKIFNQLFGHAGIKTYFVHTSHESVQWVEMLAQGRTHKYCMKSDSFSSAGLFDKYCDLKEEDFNTMSRSQNVTFTTKETALGTLLEDYSLADKK